MNNSFINCFEAEWIKKRRSFASWLVIIGGFFIPLVSIIIFLVYPKQMLSMHAAKDFWKLLFHNTWRSMAFMLLPMGIVLAVSLITQLEFKNNTWKQLHTTPVPMLSIYFSKLVMLLIMMLQLIILFNIGIYLSALIPSFFNTRIPYPLYPIDLKFFFWQNARYFIVCLPMVSLQYIISLQFKNFLIPVGAGLAMVVGGLIALTWKYSYMIPSNYTALNFLENQTNAEPAHNLIYWSLGYFILFSLLGFWLYISKKEKG